MKHTITLIVSSILIINITWAKSSSVIDQFSSIHFDGKLASKFEEFNATDVILVNAPRRRIIDYVTTNSTTYLWYEHGGIGLHQHLVSFKKTNPKEVLTSYSFSVTKHKNIDKLIKDSLFLNENINSSDEL